MNEDITITQAYLVEIDNLTGYSLFADFYEKIEEVYCAIYYETLLEDTLDIAERAIDDPYNSFPKEILYAVINGNYTSEVHTNKTMRHLKFMLEEEAKEWFAQKLLERQKAILN